MTGDDTLNRQWQAVTLCPDGRKDGGSSRHGAQWVQMLLAPICLTMLRMTQAEEASQTLAIDKKV